MTKGLKDNAELRKLILDNPELPLLVFVNEDCNNGFHKYTQGNVSVGIEELVLHNEEWCSKEEYRDIVFDSYSETEEYTKLSDTEYEKMINDIVDNTNFTNAIIVYVD